MSCKSQLLTLPSCMTMAPRFVFGPRTITSVSDLALSLTYTLWASLSAIYLGKWLS